MLFQYTDILVVGGGAAGIKAALTAADCGRRVILAVERQFAGSTYYSAGGEWGILYAEDDIDIEDFYHEILSSSCGCIDEQLVHILCKNSLACYKELLSYGLRFLSLSELGLAPCFGKKIRGAMLLDFALMRHVFLTQLSKRSNILVMDHSSACALLIRGGECRGAILAQDTGELVCVSASAIILACGGAGNLWQHATAFDTLNGSAYAMAARHGARIVNLEFIQFLLATISPYKGLSYNNYSFIEHPRLINGAGEEFLKKYLPESCSVEHCLDLRSTHGPFSIEDDAKFLDLSIIAEGGATVVPAAKTFASPRYRGWVNAGKRFGFSPETPMSIYPHCQGFNGGILLSPHDDSVRTDIPRLFAAGEAAGGCHGANRMGGNAILATQVFGKMSALSAVSISYGRKVKFTERLCKNALEAEYAMCGNDSSITPDELMFEIKHIMQASGFLERCEETLSAGLQKLNGLHAAFHPLHFMGTKQIRKAFSAINALCSAQLILTAMKNRRESRGGHYRSDYPKKNNASMQYTSFDSHGNLIAGIVHLPNFKDD